MPWIVSYFTEMTMKGTGEEHMRSPAWGLLSLHSAALAQPMSLSIPTQSSSQALSSTSIAFASHDGDQQGTGAAGK
jgi:hypothetical protein